MHESFVYIWTNKNNDKKYIGKHKGLDTDGYISSGNYFNLMYQKDPKSFYRIIVFRGTDPECLSYEQSLIKEHKNSKGWSSLYNLTTWDDLRVWKRTCLHCNAICYPMNEDWAAAFETQHFDNCRKNPEVISQKTRDKIRGLPKDQRRKAERVAWWKEYDRNMKMLKDINT